MADWNDYKYFLAVSRMGAIVDAAHELGVDEQLVRSRIVTLEATLGVRLFERTPAGVIHTAAGRDLIARVEAAASSLSRVDGPGTSTILRRVAVKLRTASSFVDVAAAVCTFTHAELGIARCVVCVHQPEARPILMVDNGPITDVMDAQRKRFVSKDRILDPLLHHVLAHHGAAGVEVIDHGALDAMARDADPEGESHRDVLLVPILNLEGLLGSIRCFSAQVISDALRSDLMTLGIAASLRIADLGITALPDPLVRALTTRQLEVAGLAARGRTNHEIAAQLGLSENTVKKHLKDVFETLHVSNRAGLASLLVRITPHELPPIGITRRDGLTITRGV